MQQKFEFRNFTGHRKTDPDKPSPTILARGNGQGGVCAIPHYNGKRRLTIRESASIQTFPENFHFLGAMNSCYRQIGNADCLQDAQLLADMIRERGAKDIIIEYYDLCTVSHVGPGTLALFFWGKDRRSNAAPARGKDRSKERIKITCQQTAAFAIIGAHTAVVKLADAPDLGSGAARRSGSSPLGGTTSGHGARCKGMSKAHPFRFYAGPSSFPKNLRCANLFWEPYSFTYKANLVSPWAFAQGLYSIACSLAQSILRSVTELPAQWAIPKFGRMPKPHRGCRQNIRPHPFFQKISAARIFFGNPILSLAKQTL